MLNRLLAFITTHQGTLSPANVATYLGVSQALVESMLETLTKLGYLAVVGECCDAHSCGTCRQCGVTSTSARPRVWTPTSKGREATSDPPAACVLLSG